jgi:Fur family transcriptional regulator, stress-responsive regulator
LNNSRKGGWVGAVPQDTKEQAAGRPDDAAALLRAAGLRVTRPRLAVLEALSDQPHADADHVARSVRVALGSVSTQGVYDVLHALAENGLVRCIEPAGSPARYELRVGDNHHHVVCRSCGAIEDVDCALGARPCLETDGDSHGFVIDEAEVTYWGTCPSCLSTTSA